VRVCTTAAADNVRYGVSKSSDNIITRTCCPKRINTRARVIYVYHYKHVTRAVTTAPPPPRWSVTIIIRAVVISDISLSGAL